MVNQNTIVKYQQAPGIYLITNIKSIKWPIDWMGYNADLVKKMAGTHKKQLELRAEELPNSSLAAGILRRKMIQPFFPDNWMENNGNQINNLN